MSKASCTAPARNHLPDTHTTDPNPAPPSAQAPGSSPPAPAPASLGHWRPAALPAPSHLTQVLSFRACSVILCFYQSHSPALKSLNVFPQNSRMISSSQNNFFLSKSILISCTRRRHLLTKPSDLPPDTMLCHATSSHDNSPSRLPALDGAVLRLFTRLFLPGGC